MSRYDPAGVKRLAARIAMAAGVAESDAVVFADSLVEADVSGTATHGISRLAIYIRRLRSGLIDPRAVLRVERARAASLAVDAGNGLGQVQACKVLDLLVSKARDCGVAAATVRNSQHFGALSYYCNRAAAQDMILLATTNCEPAMSPHGGCQAFLGTNPIAASFPTGKGFPVKVDLSASVVARGRVIAAHKAGRAIPQGWALDPEGNPTTDPEQALLGTILTMAGHKGYALAVLVEVLSGVLSGASVGSKIGSMYKDLDRKQDVGHFFCLMDISAFVDVCLFKQRMDATIDAIKACRRQRGIDELFVPGERSHRTAQLNRQNGITLGSETVREITILCQELGVPFDLVCPMEASDSKSGG
ncbi:MAG: Ldh family oxidoreductase [Acidobacteriota bacterium]